MLINRRQFLLLTAVFTATGCQSGGNSSSAGRPPRLVDAGPSADFGADGLYDKFKNQGFFLIRRGDHLFALSSYCTHRKCKLIAESGRTFYCKCHGSTFDPDGKVTTGPATRDLPALATQTDDQGRLIVTVPSI